MPNVTEVHLGVTTAARGGGGERPLGVGSLPSVVGGKRTKPYLADDSNAARTVLTDLSIRLAQNSA